MGEGSSNIVETQDSTGQQELLGLGIWQWGEEAGSLFLIPEVLMGGEATHLQPAGFHWADSFLWPHQFRLWRPCGL